MRFEEERVSPQKYLDLYKQSQGRIKDEEIISESLLSSLIKELKRKEVDFFVDVTVRPFVKDDKNKSNRKFFFDEMKKLFFDDVEWEFEKITSVGMSTFGYEIYFKLKEQRYGLFIPFVKNITVDNVGHACYGKYNLSIEEKPSIYCSVVASYDVEDIKVAIKKESEV